MTTRRQTGMGDALAHVTSEHRRHIGLLRMLPPRVQKFALDHEFTFWGLVLLAPPLYTLAREGLKKINKSVIAESEIRRQKEKI